MRKQCVPGPLLSYIRPGNEAELTTTVCVDDTVYNTVQVVDSLKKTTHWR